MGGKKILKTDFLPFLSEIYKHSQTHGKRFIIFTTMSYSALNYMALFYFVTFGLNYDYGPLM